MLKSSDPLDPSQLNHFHCQNDGHAQKIKFLSEAPIPNKSSTMSDPSKECKNKKAQKNQNSNKKKGQWSYEQNVRYHWFLEIHSQHFLEKHRRRANKIFKIMETFLENREAEQCRSHHQKMEKRYGEFSVILLNLRYQFYQTYDAAPIIEDLGKFNIPFPDGILSEEELFGKSKPPHSNQALCLEYENQQIQQLQGDYPQNMLDDNYQRNLNQNLF